MIKIDSITCSYNTTPVLSGLSLELYPDDFSVLIGPNGAGKSTLLYAIMGFMKLQSGSIRIADKELGAYKRGELARLIAYVPQESVFSFDFQVRDLVLMGRYPYQGLLETWTEEDHRIADAALEKLGLSAFRDRWFSQLSGGEKQRVLIARALAQETHYIFLDESLSQLDINHQIEIMRMLKEIRKESKIGIVLISHNLNLAANYASRIIFLKDGKVMAVGNPDELMRSDLLKGLFGIDLELSENPLSRRMNIIYPS